MPRKRNPKVQMLLPGVIEVRAGRKQIYLKNRKIPHEEILAALQDSKDGARGVVEIYRREILPTRTRTIHLLGRKSPAQIIRTLLGFEVKASFKRIHCPDMVTARFLKLFTELGCTSIKLPYDPTLTARLIPELEAAAQRLVSGVQELFPNPRELQLYVIRKVFQHVRRQLQSS